MRSRLELADAWTGSRADMTVAIVASNKAQQGAGQGSYIF